MTLEQDYTLDEVAEALRMSTRWVRDRIKDGAAHQRKGHKITFTIGQVDALREQFTKNPAEQSMTTGGKRRSA